MIEVTHRLDDFWGEEHEEHISLCIAKGEIYYMWHCKDIKELNHRLLQMQSENLPIRDAWNYSNSRH
jgi:hypothetical protein